MEFSDIKTTTKKTQGVNTCEYIILHHTGGSGLWQTLTNYLSGENGYVSVHYTIGKNGEIAKIGEDTDILWHVGMGIHPSINGGQVSNLNHYCVGIEIVSNGLEYTDAQREATKLLCTYLCKEYGISTQNILRHADVSGYRGKWDVGLNFFTDQDSPMGTFRTSVEEELEKENSLKNVSEWAKDSAKKALEKGIIKNWTAPQEIVVSQKMGWIWYNIGLIEKHPEAEGLTLEQVAVVLDRDGKLD